MDSFKHPEGATPLDPNELAVPLAGKKSKLTRNDIVKYFGYERLGLDEKAVQVCFKQLQDAFPEWERLIQRSFLSKEMKKKIPRTIFRKTFKIEVVTQARTGDLVFGLGALN